jgi:ferredoxin
MRIEADRDRCTGAGMCVLAAPALFDQDDDGLVVVLDAAPGPDHATAARNAVTTCPASALGLRDD